MARDSTAMAALLDELAELVAEKLERRLRAGGSQAAPVDQSTSPLGRKRHCQAVRARLERGEPGASIVGRRHFLTPEALADEMSRCSAASAKTPVAPCSSVRAELERELRIVGGGGGKAP